MVQLGNDWDALLADQFTQDYYQTLRKFLAQEYHTKTIYPDMYDLFNALKYTPFSDVRAVMLGQDPYHGAGQAHGLCFSVQKGVPKPPSLQNMFKELQADVGFTPPSHGNLTDWTKQGILLLNTVLTVQESKPNSHKGKGWEIFTDRVITLLNERERPLVFFLWGANARAKKSLITSPQHLILEAPHPSPLSAHNGFFGCRHFSKANAFLQAHGQLPIDWKIHE